MAEVQDFEVVDADNTARWPEGMAPAGINNAARADEGILARWYSDTDASIVSSGSANAYAITSSRTMAALFNNLLIAWTSNHTNTGASTLALNGLTAKNIKRPNGDALSAGDIVSGQPVIVVYKSSPDEWRLLSGPGAVVAIASQAEMEAATDVAKATSPGRQHFHPGHPKAWGRVTNAGVLVSGDYNVTSATKDSTGTYTVTLAITMADTNYLVVPSVEKGANPRIANWSTLTVTTFVIEIANDSGTATDEDFGFVVYGDI